MKRSSMLIALCFGMTLSPSLASAQILDSTGQLNTGVIGYGDAVYSSTWERISGKPETAMRWPTWEEVTGKPASASRWPSWNEVTGKPSTFPPTAHNHDDRYVRKGASGAISGNLSVSGTVTGNRLVTADVGGDRWCRANSSGRILCTQDEPAGMKRNTMDGWPLVLNCGTGFNEPLYLTYLNHDNQGRVSYWSLGGKRENIIFNSDGSWHKWAAGDNKPHSACYGKHIDDIPASRKIL